MATYHRLAGADEEVRVRQSGFLWGRAKRESAANVEPTVKAYLGPLPEGEAGYTFETEVKPSHARKFFGKPGGEWREGDEGVVKVPGQPGYVMIAVEVVG